MSVRLQIAALIFMMVQGVLFGVGVTLLLATPLAEFAMQMMPWVVGVSFLVSLPLSWMIAPRLRARYWRRRAEMERAAAGGAVAPASPIRMS